MVTDCAGREKVSSDVRDPVTYDTDIRSEKGIWIWLKEKIHNKKIMYIYYSCREIIKCQAEIKIFVKPLDLWILNRRDNTELMSSFKTKAQCGCESAVQMSLAQIINLGQEYTWRGTQRGSSVLNGAFPGLRGQKWRVMRAVDYGGPQFVWWRRWECGSVTLQAYAACECGNSWL